MDASTRPPRQRSQGNTKKLVHALAAALFLQASVASGATNQNIEATRPVIPAPSHVAGDMAITTVAMGHESLEVSARFSEDGKVLVDDITWRITDQGNSVIFEKSSALVNVAVPPGTYHVQGSYGTAHIDEGVTVQPGTKLGINFIINAGALRILPRVQGSAVQQLLPTTKIFALTGIAKGQLIATSKVPGEVINVVAGQYRIESKFDSGNALAVTDVNVRAGFMSAVNIDHIAGVAHLQFQGADEDVEWTVQDATGSTLQVTPNVAPQLVLKPGRYTANLKTLLHTLTKPFEISVGETTDVVFGN